MPCSSSCSLLLFIVLAVFAMIVGTLFVMYPESVIPVWFQIPVAVWLGWQIRKGKNDLIYSIIALLLAVWFCDPGRPISRFPSLGYQISVVVWCIILFIYVFFASTIPVQNLLQPRDYINSHQLMVAMAFLILGIVIAHPVLSAPAINHEAFAPGSDVPDLAPILFIVIACGAISGFHSLASSGTTVKQVDKETDTLPIGYGAMITESFLAVLVIVAAGAGLGMGLEEMAGIYRSGGLPAPLCLLVIGQWTGSQTGCIYHWFGQPFLVLWIACEIRGSICGGIYCFLCQYHPRFGCQDPANLPAGDLHQHPVVRFPKPLNNRYIATLMMVLAAAAMTFFKPGGQGAMVLWPLFGSLNQLMAALALGVVTVYFHIKKIPLLYTLLPMLVILVLTLWAMIKNLAGFIT